MLLKFRYDFFSRCKNTRRACSIDFRYNAFFKEHYVDDWMATVGPDPPFMVTDTYNVDPNQLNIISYSLYGNNKRYYDHLMRRINEAQLYHPEWIVRVYLHDKCDLYWLKLLVSTGSQVFVVHDSVVRPGNAAGMFWRFLPLTDATLNVMVKDIDDEITRYDWVVDPMLQHRAPDKCFTGLWTSPFPQSHIRASTVVKLKSCKVAFTQTDVMTFPLRMPYGADEYFLTLYSRVDEAHKNNVFQNAFVNIGWHLARDAVPTKL